MQTSTLLKKIKRFASSTVRKIKGKDKMPVDFTPQEIEIIHSVQPYTKTGPERIQTMIKATQYLAQNNISGAIVECGVYKGGSMMAAAKALLSIGRQDYDLYLFDTYEGMDQPTDKDVTYAGLVASEKRKVIKEWSYCPLDTVKSAFSKIPYDSSRIHYVKGKVEDTVPEQVPDQIALLRLDTDWYEPTKHELEHMYPNLVPGGILIIDDYGHWQGAQEAVDEYIANNNLKLFLNRIDYTGRLAIKP